jgi:hypothetical protein
MWGLLYKSYVLVFKPNYFVIFVFIGVAIDRTVYFPFNRTIEEPKTHTIYLKNGNQASGRTIQGIKGPTPLSSILLLPIQAPYDSMHLVYRGHVKTLLN